MRVSIIIPTYNRPALLRRALRSVSAQTFGAWEAIVVDDGDGQGAAAARAQNDPRIRDLTNPGMGQVDARNAALAQARGDVIALLDDDDWWQDSGHLARVTNRLSQGPALVYCPCWLVYEAAGQEIRRELFDMPTTPASLRHNNTLIASSVAYCRSFHTDLGPFDRDVGSYWDWDWFLRTLAAGQPLVRADTPGVCYSVRPDGLSAVPDAPPRQAFFETFRAKHGLDIVIKNHASLLAETSSGNL